MGHTGQFVTLRVKRCLQNHLHLVLLPQNLSFKACLRGVNMEDRSKYTEPDYQTRLFTVSVADTG